MMGLSPIANATAINFASLVVFVIVKSYLLRFFFSFLNKIHLEANVIHPEHAFKGNSFFLGQLIINVVLHFDEFLSEFQCFNLILTKFGTNSLIDFALKVNETIFVQDMIIITFPL